MGAASDSQRVQARDTFHEGERQRLQKVLINWRAPNPQTR